MSAEIIMPKMGDAMTEGKVVRWYKKAGDAVKKGEPVLEIETDKVNLDLEAEADGKLGAHQAKEGDMVPVGGVLVNILAEGEADEAPQRRATDKKDRRMTVLWCEERLARPSPSMFLLDCPSRSHAIQHVRPSAQPRRVAGGRRPRRTRCRTP